MNRRAYLALVGAGVAGAAVLGGRPEFGGPEAGGSAADGSPWATYRGDARRTGFTPDASLPTSVGDATWRFDPEYALDATPVADADRWYVADAWNVYAVDRATGERRWRHPIRDRTDFPCITEGAAVATGDEVVVGTCDGVRALDPADGSVVWTREDVRAGRARPALYEGSVFLRARPVDAAEERLYRLDPADGTTQWTARTAARSLDPVAIADDGVYLVGNVDDGDAESGRLYRLGLDGDEQWQRTFEYDPTRTPPAVDDRTAYVAVGETSTDCRLVALDAGTGESRWTFDAESRVDHPPALAGETVYVGTAGGSLVALDAGTGDPRWRYDLGPRAATAPTAAANGVCVTMDDGTLHAVGEDGDRLWTASFEEGPHFADPVVTDEAVIGSGRRLVAFD